MAIHKYSEVEAGNISLNLPSTQLVNVGSGKSYGIRKIINILQKISGVYSPIKNKGLYISNEIWNT